MASNAFLRLILEADKGCHQDLICYCTIRPKLERIKRDLSPEEFEAFLDYICTPCNVTTTPVPPYLPPPPVTPPPVTEPEPPPVITPQSACRLPDPANYR